MEEKNKVLAIGAHADDIELGCAGTLIRLKEEGFKIYGLIVTDSGGRTDRDPSQRTKYVEIRKKEAKNSAGLLGFNKRPDLDLFDEVLFFANLQDTTVKHEGNTIYPIVEIVREISPSIVFTHSEHDTQSDHIHTALSTISAVRERAIILKYEIYVSDHRSFTPKVYADITEILSQKKEALECFVTQIDRGTIDLDKVRERAEERGREVGVKYAECFEMEAFQSYADILSIPSQVFVRHPLWDSFVKDGAALVLPVAPLVFTGPDAPHEVQIPPYSLEVKPPKQRPLDWHFWKNDRGKFKTLGELLRSASSAEKKEEIKQSYPDFEEDKLVPYYVIPNSGYTGIGDARGLAEVIGILLQLNSNLIAIASPQLEIVTADTVLVAGYISSRNLIVFGGGGSNKVTAHFDELLDKIYPHQRYHHSLSVHGDIDGCGNKIGNYSPQVGSTPGQDCASLVFLRPNALGEGIPGGYVLIFDGYETAGTLAACYVATRPQFQDILQQFSNLIRNYLAVQLEIQVKEVIDGQPIVDQIELVEDTLMGFR